MSITIDLSGLRVAHVLPLGDGAPADAHVDPRSEYAERFWLPTIGPSALWLLRHFAARFDAEPEGFTFDIESTSHALGIRSGTGRNATFVRTMHRIVSFGLGAEFDDQTLMIRVRLPLLHGGHVARLPKSLQRQHGEHLRRRRGQLHETNRRARDVARTLLELGDSADVVRRQLIAWGVDAQVAVDALANASAASTAPSGQLPQRSEHIWPDAPPIRLSARTT